MTTIGQAGGMVGAAPKWSLMAVAVAGALVAVVLLSLARNPRTRGSAVLVLIPLLIVGALAVTFLLVGVPSGRQPSQEEVAVRQATEAMLRPPNLHEPTAKGLTVDPPDEAGPDKPADERISVKIQQDARNGKGMIIFIKANRKLEAGLKTVLDALGQLSGHPAEPALAKVADTLVHLPGVTQPKTPSGPANPQAPIPVAKNPAPSAAQGKPTPPASTTKPPAAALAAPQPGGDAYEETVTAYGETEADCEAMLDVELQKALARHIERRLGREAAGAVLLPPSDVRKWIVKKSAESVQLPNSGPMLQLKALFRVDDAVNTRIDQEWAKAQQRLKVDRRQARMAEGLLWLGGGLGIVLLFLSVVYGYLKIDLATGGAYRWRLRLATVVILLSMAAAGIALVPW